MSAITPPIIGICGYPTHGKSTAQRFLEKLGVEARDDAEVLRRRVMSEFNLTWEDVTTQEGKLKVVRGLNGDMMTVRKLLGDYGQVRGEIPFGPNFWVYEAIEQLRSEVATGRPPTPVSFGSIRRSQAAAVKAAGGFIIAIHDPRKPMSTHGFDEYEYELVDCMVFNDSTSDALEIRTLMAVAGYLRPSTEQIVSALFADKIAASVDRMMGNVHAA